MPFDKTDKDDTPCPGKKRAELRKLILNKAMTRPEVCPPAQEVCETLFHPFWKDTQLLIKHVYCFM